MFTKDNDIIITIYFCFKMMSWEKGKFLYSFFILLTQWYEFPAVKLTNFHIFIVPLPLKVTLFPSSTYLTAHFKVNYEAGCIGRFSEKKTKKKTNKQKTKNKKKQMYPGPLQHQRWSSLFVVLVEHRDVSKTISTAKMELFVAVVAFSR